MFGWIAAQFLLPIYFLVYFFSRHVDYITHVGAASGANFAYSNVCLSPAFNRGYWNFGYHLAHHHAPRTHWNLLPQVYRSCRVEPEQRASIETLNIYGLLRPLRLRWMAIAPGSKPKAHLELEWRDWLGHGDRTLAAGSRRSVLAGRAPNPTSTNPCDGATMLGPAAISSANASRSLPPSPRWMPKPSPPCPPRQSPSM